AAEPPYDLVLMDIQMPRMDGYEATRLIRADGRFTRLPIIAMTAHALVEEQRKAFDAGMDDLITKPINLRAMFGTISGHLSQSVVEPPCLAAKSGIGLSYQGEGDCHA
ncbi:MAG TPA: response regulator, partial [Desulfuromonadaceae bacterium]